LHYRGNVGDAAILQVLARDRRDADRRGLYGRVARLRGDDDLFELIQLILLLGKGGARHCKTENRRGYGSQ
jgi:hypothetical protein